VCTSRTRAYHAASHTLHTSCVLKQTQCDKQQRPQRERKLNEQGVARDGSYSALTKLSNASSAQ
jgi:hypothetical protein